VGGVIEARRTCGARSGSGSGQLVWIVEVDRFELTLQDHSAMTLSYRYGKGE
jgi:hypothetical protein